MQDERFMRDPIEENGLLKLSGTVEHVIYANEENGFAICDLGTEEGDLVTVTGILVASSIMSAGTTGVMISRMKSSRICCSSTSALC